MSDHDLVITELDLKIKPPKKKPRKIFLFKRADVERLRDSISNDVEALRSIEWKSASELDDLWAQFESTILKAIEQYVPYKKNGVYIAKQSNSRPMKIGRNSKNSEKQQRASY